MSNRGEQLDHLRHSPDAFDVVVIGGGAMGLGIALESLRQGWRTALFEQRDFAHGTSSRSTKLIHGGVRYLEQGDFGLVRGALQSRKALCDAYPQIVRPLRFVIPTYGWPQHMYYRTGLWLYDRLAGRANLAPARSLSRSETLQSVPYLRAHDITGGIAYTDAQFDDAQLACRFTQQIWQQRGIAINYAQVIDVRPGARRGATLIVVDQESGDHVTVTTQVVVNATGVAADQVRKIVEPQAAPRLRFSQGTHIVLDADPRWDCALLVPKTQDGRVVFMIPWLGKLLIGTTDVEVAEPRFDPIATREEIEFLLDVAGHYLDQPPRMSDVRSAFAGHRALVVRYPGRQTRELSRNHVVERGSTGMWHVWGGKWTTFASIARDVVRQIRAAKVIDVTSPGPAMNFPSATLDGKSETPEVGDPLDARLPITWDQIERGADAEMARTVEDILARRTRCLFLDAQAAWDIAPRVANSLAKHLGRSPAWAEQEVADFRQTAKQFLVASEEPHAG